ncbi:MAG: quinone oxidoreductase [Pseudonocardiales bacterium]|nr:quinone oxidoreductase [Pseudonocardiales bacterium]
MILQYPVWWFSMPAVLKGWADRVFTRGFDVRTPFVTHTPGRLTAEQRADALARYADHPRDIDAIPRALDG